MASDPLAELESLKLELAEVKKQLSAYKSTPSESLNNIKPTSSNITSTSANHAFRLLGLARELRNTVFELCVVVEKVVINRPGGLKSYDIRSPPGAKNAKIQLFRVSKQVNDEARELYFGKNLFIVLAGPRICQ